MFKADLFIFDTKYSILDFELTIEKDNDDTGLPVSNPYGGKMSITFASTRNDTDLLEAAMASRMMVQGYVRIYRRDGIQKFFDYEFANAYILFFKESYDATSKNPVTTKIIIAPGILKKEDWIFTNYWNPSNPYLSAAAPISSTDDEGEIIDSYFEDVKGNRIKKPRKNQEIYLIVKTEAMTGKSIDIDLSDSNIDFKYLEDILPDDQLLDHPVNSDLMRIPLTTIKQR